MKSKLLVGLVALGLVGNTPNSQAGIIDWAWNNRQAIVTTVVVAAAAYYWLTQEEDQAQPDLDQLERDQQAGSISSSKCLAYKRSHSPKGTDPSSPTLCPAGFAPITEDFAELDGDSD